MGYRVLGQAAPAVNTDTTLFTATKDTVVSTFTICNRDPNATTFRLAVQPAGAALAAVHYISYDIPISGNDTVVLTMGVTLTATDVVSVRAGAATLSFHAYGQEVA